MTSGGTPMSSREAGDQERVRRSKRSELEPHDGSVTKRPVSLVRTQSLSMPTWAMARNVSGSCSADPQEARRRGDGDPVPALLEDAPRIARAHQLGRPRAAARESTFGQAQISRPVPVVEDHALAHAGARSRPRCPRPARPLASRADRDALADRAASRASCRRPASPGTPGRAACDHSRCPMPRWLPGSVEDDRPAAARAQVDGQGMAAAHGAPLRGPGAAGLARLRSGWPAAKRSISAAAIRPPLARVSMVAPPMCGSSRTVGKASSRCRLSGRRGAGQVEHGPAEVAASAARRRGRPRRRGCRARC